MKAAVNTNKFTNVFSVLYLAVRFTTVITFRVRHSRSEMYIGHGRLCLCACVCLYLATFLHYFTDPHVTSGNGRVCPHSCALLGGFAIGARVSLL